jgi:hypothetical protein
MEDAVLEEDADQVTGYRFSFITFTCTGKDYYLRTSSEGNLNLFIS